MTETPELAPVSVPIPAPATTALPESTTPGPSPMDITVFVRHNTKVYEIHTQGNATGEVLSTQLYSLTNIPPFNQRILGAPTRRMLDPNLELFEQGIQNGSRLLMIGSLQSRATAPDKRSRENASEEESPLAERARPKGPPPGMHNFGNTCYFNAVIQVLASIPELAEAVKEFHEPESNPPPYSKLVHTLAGTFGNMGPGSPIVYPSQLLGLVRVAYPDFNSKDARGRYEQQDAEEFMTRLLGTLREALKPPMIELPEQPIQGEPEVNSDLIARLMLARPVQPVIDSSPIPGGPRSSPSSRLPEEGSTAPIVSAAPPHPASSDCSLMIPVFISQQTQSLEQYLFAPIAPSPSAPAPLPLTLARLPPYLMFRFVRFHVFRKSGTTTKVKKRVAYPMTFDGSRLLPVKKSTGITGLEGRDEPAGEDGVAHGTNPTEKEGMTYTLHAVLTHKGSTANSGHYVSFVRCSDSSTEFFCFDDEDVQVVETDYVRDLCGGTEGDIAYILVYKLGSPIKS